MAKGTLDPNASATKKLLDLVYYSVDKASPYALAQHEATNTLAKIADYTLASLAITDQGTAIMWLWINAHCQPEAKPVGADIASKCEKVSDVRDAVLKNMVTKS
jgi:hypothetical protein